MNRAPLDPPFQVRLAQRWRARRTFGAPDLPPLQQVRARLRADGVSLAVVLPALNEEATIGEIVGAIDRARIATELLVVDGGSSDDTVARARAAGADVIVADSILPEIPAVGGKGDSMWRSLAATNSDLVCWIDADIKNFRAHFVSRLVAPLLADESISFVKAFYRRPLDAGGTRIHDGGGRVTELLARPMLASFFPELGGIVQPLAGEYAGRRGALESVPFFSGYSVEAGLLIDLLESVGLDAMAQSDLDVRVHRNRPLGELSPMAHAIGRTIMRRACEWGRATTNDAYLSLPMMRPGHDAPLEVEEVERPPVASLEQPAEDAV